MMTEPTEPIATFSTDRAHRDLNYALLDDCRELLSRIPASRQLIARGAKPKDLAEIFFAGVESAMSRLRGVIGDDHTIANSDVLLFDDDDEY